MGACGRAVPLSLGRELMPPLFRPMFSLAAVLTAATPLSALMLPSGTRHAAPPTRRAHLVASADKPVTAAVIGGGLGGLAVAIALRRVGIDAHVYERAAELKGTAGTGLTLWPNGLSALAAIDPGLESLILADGKGRSMPSLCSMPATAYCQSGDLVLHPLWV